jgi:hypothetical protein
MSLRSKLATLIGFFVAAVAVSSALLCHGVSARVEESQYAEIVRARQLIAEVLPPPEYIIESYLVALQSVAASGEVEIERLHERWNALEQNYESRHDFWDRELEDDDLRRELLETAYEPAIKFYALGDRELWPAVQNGETERASALVHTDLRELYEAHKRAIEAAVARADVLATKCASATAHAIDLRKSVLFGLAGLIAVLGAGIAWTVYVVLAQLDAAEALLRERAHAASPSAKEPDQHAKDWPEPKAPIPAPRGRELRRDQAHEHDASLEDASRASPDELDPP